MTREEFIKEWLEDLRSGKFKQCDATLGNEDGIHYCCLGVACITGQRLNIEGSQWGPQQLETDDYPGDWFVNLIGCQDPMISLENGDRLSAAAANDQGYPFKEIADGLKRSLLP